MRLLDALRSFELAKEEGCFLTSTGLPSVLRLGLSSARWLGRVGARREVMRVECLLACACVKARRLEGFQRLGMRTLGCVERVVMEEKKRFERVGLAHSGALLDAAQRTVSGVVVSASRVCQ